MLKIAIIIPTYNSASTILATLDSLKGQISDPRIHSVVIADDCSKDNTLVLCKTHAAQNEKMITFQSAENQGERRNINRILPYLQEEKIDWFMILHSDDLAKPDWVEEYLRCMHNAGADLASICSSWDDWYPAENRIKAGENKAEPEYEDIKGTTESIIGTFRQGCWWHISGCAIKVEAFEKIGGFTPDMPQLGDLDWLLRALSAHWTIRYIPRSLILYRQHQHSVSSNSFRNDLDTKEFLVILSQYLKVLDRSTLFFLWKQRLKTALRRLGRSFLLCDFALIRRRFSTLWKVNTFFGKLALKQLITHHRRSDLLR